MDEALEVVDVVADSGFEGIAAALVAALGLLAILAGLGLWLLTEMGLLFLPAALIAVGLVLLVAPGIGLVLAEFA